MGHEMLEERMSEACKDYPSCQEALRGELAAAKEDNTKLRSIIDRAAEDSDREGEEHRQLIQQLNTKDHALRELRDAIRNFAPTLDDASYVHVGDVRKLIESTDAGQHDHR